MNYEIIINLIKIVREGEAILRSNPKIDVYSKEGNGNFVTTSDILLGEYITKALTQMYPESEIISEEKDNVGNSNAKLKFIVDPIDGTANYIKDWPCSISIAVIYEEELVIGMILDVQSRNVYYAIKGERCLYI